MDVDKLDEDYSSADYSGRNVTAEIVKIILDWDSSREINEWSQNDIFSRKLIRHFVNNSLLYGIVILV